MQLDCLPADDNQLWLVKWIDEFRLPHLRTRSPSVHILCQRLEHTDEKTLNRLTSEDVGRILSANQEGAGDWLKCAVLAGYIPYLSIGMLFKNGRHVGTLPASRAEIALRDTEDPSSSILIDDLVPSPPRWDPKFPYRTLNRREFSGLMNHGFKHSRCMVHHERDTQYIIPRSVIFRCFYGQTPAIANAFCKGPWKDTSSDLICYSILESGLVTRRNDEEGTWDIILQPKTKREHARLLAALIFDEYAAACAESVYANTLQDRGGDRNKPWFASAKIPFDTTIQPMSLTVKGYVLDRLFCATSDKFLVTSIVAAPFPAHFPEIRYEKSGSSAKGETIIKVDEPAPFQEATTTNPAPENVVGVSDEDINLDEGSLYIQGDDFTWADAPRLKKLVKPQSNQYNPPRPGGHEQPGGDEVSAGTGTNEKGARTEALIETLMRRSRQKQFSDLLEIFEGFVMDGTIERYSIFSPTDRSMRMPHSGLECWNFLSEDARTTGRWPKRGWRLLEFPKIAAEDSKGSVGVPRSALVVELTVAGVTGYWIEIETRPDTGEGFRSPYIVTEEDPHDLVAHFIEVIAELNGINLLEQLPREASDLVNTKVRCYKHCYVSKTSNELNKETIKAFLKR